MDHAERDELSEWMRRSMTLLAPPDGWEPDQRRARARVIARLERRPQSSLRRLLKTAVVTLGIACVSIVAIPLTRVAAQQTGIGWHRVDQVWYWLTLGRTLQLVRLVGLPDDVKLLGSQVLSARSSRESVTGGDVAGRAGFVPRLPDSGLVPGKPQMSVSDPASFVTALRTSDLEMALKKAHVTDEMPPSGWDGGRIGVQIGSGVYADWSNLTSLGFSHLTLAQSAAPVFTLPAGADLRSFTAINLRAAGRSREKALELAQFAEPAALLLTRDGLGQTTGMENAVAVRVVSLRNGAGLIVEEWDSPVHSQLEIGPPIRRISLLWKTPDRTFALGGELNVPLDLPSYDLAGVVATMVGVADSIH